MSDESQVAVPEEALNPAVGRVRVNLLPSRVVELGRARRAQGIAAACVLGAIAVTGGLWMWARFDVSKAQEAVDAARVTNGQLLAEAAQYADVPEAYRIVDQAQAEIALAMAPEIRWSFVLNDLSLTIPQGVGLSSMAVTTTGTVPAATAATTDDLGQSVGSINYSGEATSFPTVATWLDSQSKQPIYTNVYLGTATKSTDTGSGQTVVGFTSTSDLTPAALSRRFTTVAEVG